MIGEGTRAYGFAKIALDEIEVEYMPNVGFHLMAKRATDFARRISKIQTNKSKWARNKEPVLNFAVAVVNFVLPDFVLETMGLIKDVAREDIVIAVKDIGECKTAHIARWQDF